MYPVGSKNPRKPCKKPSIIKAIITATASVLGSCLCPPLMEALKLQWRLKSAMATMLLVHLGEDRTSTEVFFHGDFMVIFWGCCTAETSGEETERNGDFMGFTEISLDLLGFVGIPANRLT